MTLFEVEMAVLIVVLIAGIAAMIVVHRRLLGAVYDRQKSLDSYVKAVTRDKLVVIREAQETLAEAQAVRDEARETFRRVEQHLSDPAVMRLLGGR